MSTFPITSAPHRSDASPGRNPLDAEKLRQDFPVLAQTVNGNPLVYLDNAASSQLPASVIDRLHRYLTTEHANVHRSVHTLGEHATLAYEGARKRVAQFLNADSEEEIVFTKGATEAINLVAHGYGRTFFKEGDEIVVTTLEHHSNIVPWQMLCREKKLHLRVAPINQAGEVCIDDYAKLLGDKTRLVALAHVSNALGTINPVHEMIELAHQHKAVVLIDGAQAISHMQVDVRQLDCDFYVFSGHKMYGPTGIGVLYGKRFLLEAMSPYQGGGDMILHVSFDETLYNAPPYKFEAGTPPIAAAIGLAVAVDYLTDIGLARIAEHESMVLQHASEQLGRLPGVRIIGTAREKSAVISFMVDGIHPHDVGSLLNHYGIAIRAGHHCAQPVMQHFRIPATARASFALYNTRSEVDRLVDALKNIQRLCLH